MVNLFTSCKGFMKKKYFPLKNARWITFLWWTVFAPSQPWESLQFAISCSLLLSIYLKININLSINGSIYLFIYLSFIYQSLFKPSLYFFLSITPSLSIYFFCIFSSLLIWRLYFLNLNYLHALLKALKKRRFGDLV